MLAFFISSFFRLKLNLVWVVSVVGASVVLALVISQFALPLLRTNALMVGDSNKIFLKRTFEKNFIRIYLKYKGVGYKSYITSFKRVSRPGLRVYVNNSNITSVLGGIGIAVFSLRILFFFLIFILKVLSNLI